MTKAIYMADEDQQPLTAGAAAGIERVRSIEQPLASTAGPALSDDDATHPLVPSSLDSDKICRYCLEDNDEAGDPFHPDHLIAPCQCRGGSMWVHRGCLDEWRATRSDRAFSACTECHFAYEFVEPHSEEAQAEEEGCQRERLRLKFQLLVARDVVKVFLGMQLAILVLGGVIRAVDCDLDDDVGWWSCANVSEAELLNLTAAYRYEQGDVDADLNLSACCPAGDIVNSLLFAPLKDHSRSAYYLVGVLAVCLIYGYVVSRNWRGGLCGDGSVDACCFGFCRGANNGRCAVSLCGTIIQLFAFGGGFGGCCVLVLLVSCVFVLVFTIAGALAAAMAMSVVVQRAIQRHMHVLHRRDMTMHFVVEDLCGERGCRSLTTVLVERGGTEPPMAVARTSVGNRAVLSRQVVQQRLRDAGVEAAETPTPQMRNDEARQRMRLAASV